MSSSKPIIFPWEESYASIGFIPEELDKIQDSLFRFYCESKGRKWNPRLCVEVFKIAKETEHCYYFRHHNGAMIGGQRLKRVLKESRRSYAYKDWRLALNSFRERRMRYIDILENQLMASKLIIAIANEQLDKATKK